MKGPAVDGAAMVSVNAPARANNRITVRERIRPLRSTPGLALPRAGNFTVRGPGPAPRQPTLTRRAVLAQSGEDPRPSEVLYIALMFGVVSFFVGQGILLVAVTALGGRRDIRRVVVAEARFGSVGDAMFLLGIVFGFHRQDELAALSPTGAWVPAEGAGRMIHHERPDVVQAIAMLPPRSCWPTQTFPRIRKEVARRQRGTGGRRQKVGMRLRPRLPTCGSGQTGWWESATTEIDAEEVGGLNPPAPTDRSENARSGKGRPTR